MFELLKTEGKARRGVFTCAHGTVQTPVFMNVGTQGAIKGALSAEDLKNIGCQVELSNTYHLRQPAYQNPQLQQSSVSLSRNCRMHPTFQSLSLLHPHMQNKTIHCRNRVLFHFHSSRRFSADIVFSTCSAHRNIA